MDILRDLEYANMSGTALRLDLYLPSGNATARPLVVWIHGGAWLEGDKENPPVLPLVEHGYAAASINYRLSQQALFPAQINDCKAAIRWLRAHASEYALDAEHMGVWGHSAGGHLVALLGTSGDVQALEGEAGNMAYSSRVQAVADYSGPSNFLFMNNPMLRFMRGPGPGMDHDAPDSPESKLIGGPIQQHPEKVALVNPISYIRVGAPPFLIVHGMLDTTVSMNQAEMLHQALSRAGANATLRIVANAGHDFNQIHDEALLEAFFDKTLRGMQTTFAH
jgi:acetyl esterase/lipase